MGISRLRQTHTFVKLELSRAAYGEIREKLLAAGYEHAFQDIGKPGELIDMHGIAVAKDCQDEPKFPSNIMLPEGGSTLLGT